MAYKMGSKRDTIALCPVLGGGGQSLSHVQLL